MTWELTFIGLYREMYIALKSSNRECGGISYCGCTRNIQKYHFGLAHSFRRPQREMLLQTPKPQTLNMKPVIEGSSQDVEALSRGSLLRNYDKYPSFSWAQNVHRGTLPVNTLGLRFGA